MSMLSPLIVGIHVVVNYMTVIKSQGHSYLIGSPAEYGSYAGNMCNWSVV